MLSPPRLNSSQYPEITLPLRTRWAPSPTGELHLGHLLHTLAVWGAAKTMGAAILIRFEDHDRQRCKDRYLDEAWTILERFGFLSIGASGFISNPAKPYYRQSEQEERYRGAFNRLKAAGLVYACSCTRKDLAGLSRYPGTCRDRGLPIDLDSSSPYSYRIRLPEQRSEQFTALSDQGIPAIQTGSPYEDSGDFVIRDRNGNWSYQFCVVLDDNVDGISLVVRGMDLEGSTLWQQSLERLLTGTVRPKLYWHHPLVEAPSGEKLGKRIRSTPLREWLEQGYSPEQLIAMALGDNRKDAKLSLEHWLASLG